VPPRLSIVTAVRNDRAGLEATLTSVAGQGFADCEHLILDGASTDGTAAIALAAVGGRVRAWSAPDAGFYDAANRGAALATGDVIGFLNAGDRYGDEAALARVAATFDDSAVDACWGGLRMVRPDGRTTRHWMAERGGRRSIAFGWLPPHPAFFVRRALFLGVGGFDLRYRVAADADLMLRLLWPGDLRAAVLPGILVVMAAGGMSNGSLSAILEANREYREAAAAVGLPFPLLATGGKLFRKILQIRGR
jgi:glycosyltransferase involved in cell wall biosynthesis